MSSRLPSDVTDATPLGRPLRFEFSGKVTPNRFLKAAMTERLSSWDPVHQEKRGVPSQNLVNVYKRWGEGGLGHIITGNTMIYYDQLEAAGNPIIPLDAPFHGDRFDAFAQLAQAAKAHGNLISCQVSHPGRQVTQNINPHPISASDVQLEGDLAGMKFAKPRPATQKDIQDIIRRFTHAAEYLHKAGYDGIQLHGAHGYLLSQFLAKTTNKRTDQYGGSLQNRARLIVEIARSIRAKVPASSGFILGIKINSVEFQEGGFSPEEARELCALLETAEFDYVELSGGTYQSLAFAHKRESTRKREAFFLEFADIIAPGLTKTKSYVTGGFKTVGGMVNALKSVDGVGLGRAVCQEPDLAREILNGHIVGALDQKVDQDNFSLTVVIAGSQIRQTGKDQQPIDMSRPENVQGFLKDMGQWAVMMGSGDPSNYGYVDIESVPSSPYGVVTA